MRGYDMVSYKGKRYQVYWLPESYGVCAGQVINVTHEGW